MHEVFLSFDEETNKYLFFLFFIFDRTTKTSLKFKLMIWQFFVGFATFIFFYKDFSVKTFVRTNAHTEDLDLRMLLIKNEIRFRNIICEKIRNKFEHFSQVNLR